MIVQLERAQRQSGGVGVEPIEEGETIASGRGGHLAQRCHRGNGRVELRHAGLPSRVVGMHGEVGRGEQSCCCECLEPVDQCCIAQRHGKVIVRVRGLGGEHIEPLGRRNPVVVQRGQGEAVDDADPAISQQVLYATNVDAGVGHGWVVAAQRVEFVERGAHRPSERVHPVGVEAQERGHRCTTTTTAAASMAR